MASKKDKNSQLTNAELRNMDIEALKKKLNEEEEELMRTRFGHATASMANTALLKTKRRQIARIATILNEKGQRV